MTTQMKAAEQYFPMVLFIMLYKVTLTYESVDEQYFPVVLFIMLFQTALTSIITFECRCFSEKKASRFQFDSYLSRLVFTVMGASENFKLDLSPRRFIALINVHIRQSYINCGHTPGKKER